MPSATILLTDGSEEIEFVTPYDVLVRAGFAVQSVGIGLSTAHATCTRNVRIVPDSTELPTQPTSDILILPGGGPGAETFAKHEGVRSLIRAYRDSGRWVGFICAATIALVASTAGESDAGKTEGLESAKKARVTSHPGVRQRVVDAGWQFASDDERTVTDRERKIVTSRGPGTALGFALTIVEILAGKEKRDEVAGPMLLPPSL